MAEVDAVLRRSLTSDVALVRQIAEYIVGGGGKRLRPAVLLLAAGAMGYRGHDHQQLAAVIEMIHTATLLHDDVVDESSQRRGRATANAAFGNAASVLVGDFLYSRAFQLMVATGRMRVLSILADATNEIAEGEVLQLMHVGNADIDEDAYVGVIRRKTAKLFEAAARLGAVLGNAPPAVEGGLAEYGMRLGTAFQLIDDVLDYSGDAAAIGKSLGDDLAARLGTWVALTVALLATFLGVCKVKDDNIVQAMQQAQADKLDHWAYYQARNIREEIAKATETQLALAAAAAPAPQQPAYTAAIASYQKLEADQAQKKDQLRVQADQDQQTYDALNYRDDQFDLSDALLALAISLLAMTALTHKRWLYWVALVPTLGGVVMGLAGLLGWHLHPDALARLLS
jgi:octaprenyl-diphosphate synthase